MKFKPAPDDEDIHTANERRLSELVGPLGGKLHTGRSRNDQVATDMRIWLLDNVKDIEDSLKGLIRVIVERADKEVEYIMPGYTHLQVSTQARSPSRRRSTILLLTIVLSVHNQSVGHILSFLVPSPFAPILSGCSSSCPELPSFP